MQTPELADLMREMQRPFNPAAVTFKPGAVKGQRALALAYAELREYYRRLDELFPGKWNSNVDSWGEGRVIVRLTVQMGDSDLWITRSDVGETTSESNRGEIGGTVAFAQAFKRACAQLGIGRYLYSFPQVWVDFDPSSKRFTAQAQAKLMGSVVRHYHEWEERSKEAGVDLSDITVDGVDEVDPGYDEPPAPNPAPAQTRSTPPAQSQGGGTQITQDEAASIVAAMTDEDREFYNMLSGGAKSVVLNARRLHAEGGKLASDKSYTMLAREIGFLGGADKAGQVELGGNVIIFLVGDSHPMQPVVSRLLNVIKKDSYDKATESYVPNPSYSEAAANAVKEIARLWLEE